MSGTAGKSATDLPRVAPVATPARSLSSGIPYRDRFKFRLVTLQGRHIFTNVRFALPGLSEVEQQDVTKFFEGRALEEFKQNPDKVLNQAFPGNPPYIAELATVIRDLLQLL